MKKCSNSSSRARSNKAKGRIGQQEVCKLLLKYFPELEPDDCRSNPMGSGGEDVLMSPAARRLLPMQIEVKRKKKIGAVRFMEQAGAHGPYESVAFFREDHGEWFSCISADTLLEMYRKIHDYELILNSNKADKDD